MVIQRAILADSLSNNKLELIILPTEQCNFRCTYCYEDFELGNMSDEIVNAIIKLLDRRVPNLRALNLSWFGGEPMLALPIIEAISNRADYLCKTSSECVLSGQITTNGSLLSRERFRRLIECKVTHYQITLDGFGVKHDETRKRAGGSGTFNKIWQNLVNMKESNYDFVVKIRTHFHPENIHSVFDLITKLNEEILTDKRFHIELHPLGHYGGVNDENFRVFSAHEAAKMEKLLNSYLAGTVVEGVEEKKEDNHLCYAAKANSFVVRADGRISKCTVALNDNRNQVGRLLESGQIELENSKMIPWIQTLTSSDSSHRSCPYSSFFNLENIPQI